MIIQINRISQFQYLYETLRQDIIRGVFKAGDLLPSESVLQQQYQLTQPTIWQALSPLVQKGYITEASGKRQHCTGHSYWTGRYVVKNAHDNGKGNGNLALLTMSELDILMGSRSAQVLP